MNKGKQKAKLKLCRQHRINQYLKAINGVIDGDFSPSYATERFHKLKEVKK